MGDRKGRKAADVPGRPGDGEAGRSVPGLPRTGRSGGPIRFPAPDAPEPPCHPGAPDDLVPAAGADGLSCPPIEALLWNPTAQRRGAFDGPARPDGSRLAVDHHWVRENRERDDAAGILRRHGDPAGGRAGEEISMTAHTIGK